MNTENPIPLHPELTEPVNPDALESAMSRMAKARVFYTADLPREEYEGLRGDFTLLASDLLARTVFGNADWFRAIGRDFDLLNRATKEMILFMFIHHRIEGSVLSHVIGDDWKKKANREDQLLPAKSSKNELQLDTGFDDERSKLLAEPYVENLSNFRWDFVGMRQDESERRSTTFVLMKGAFSEEEMIDISREAIVDYQLLAFGVDHLYAFDFENYGFWDYRDACLDVIGRLAPGRLPQEEIPDEIRPGKPLGFFPTHRSGVEYLAVEDSETQERLRVYNVRRSFLTTGDYTQGEPLWFRRIDINRPDAKLLSVGI